MLTLLHPSRLFRHQLPVFLAVIVQLSTLCAQTYHVSFISELARPFRQDLVDVPVFLKESGSFLRPRSPQQNILSALWIWILGLDTQHKGHRSEAFVSSTLHCHKAIIHIPVNSSFFTENSGMSVIEYCVLWGGIIFWLLKDFLLFCFSRDTGEIKCIIKHGCLWFLTHERVKTSANLQGEV